MIVTCPACGTNYRYDESRFGESQVKRLKCARCGQVFEVRKGQAVSPSGETQQVSSDGNATHTKGRTPPGQKPREETTREIDLQKLVSAAETDLPQLAPLPRDRRFSLAVILGADAGKVFRLTSPRTVLGRGADCDVHLTDSEVSRRHAMLEIRGDEITLKDLGSTNGTFVEGVRVQEAKLESQQEFSLGTTTLMLIITDVRDSEHI